MISYEYAQIWLIPLSYENMLIFVSWNSLTLCDAKIKRCKVDLLINCIYARLTLKMLSIENFLNIGLCKPLANCRLVQLYI